MSANTIRSGNSQSINLDSMIDSLEKVSFSDNTEDYFTRCAKAIHLTPDIELKEKRSFSTCCGVSFNNVCQKVSCCSVRCFGQDVYNISGYMDESGTIRLQQRVTRRELSEDDNKFTNAFFYLKLSKTYGADLPLLLKWTFTLLPPVTASYWKTWNMTSTEPLDREKADNLSRTIKKAFDLMTSVRIEMLKGDFVKTLQSSMESRRTIERAVATFHDVCDVDLESPTYVEPAGSACIMEESIQEPILEMNCSPSLSREIPHDTASSFLCSPDKVAEVAPEEVLVLPSFSREASDEEYVEERLMLERSMKRSLRGSELELDESSEDEGSSPLSNVSKELVFEVADDNQVKRIHRSPSYELAIKRGVVFKASINKGFEDIQAEEGPEQLEPIPIALSRGSTDTVKSLESISRSPIRGLHKRFQSIARRIMHLSRRSNMSSYDYPNVARSSIQIEVIPGEKRICVGDGYIKFNSEIIIRDVMLITRCSRKDAEIIAGAVKERVVDTTTLHDIWGFVKEEIQSSAIEIKIKQDPRFKMLADCEAQTVGKVPIGMVSDLFKNKAFKKNA